jgi:hypothetical protein
MSSITEFVNKIKGRTFLYVAGIMALCFIAVLTTHGLTDNWRQRDITRKNNALTSATATTDDMFSYDLSTASGRTLAYGKVTTPASECVTLGTAKGCYSKIYEQREVYTMHTRTYECGTSKSPQTCVETYWSWDNDGHNEAQASKLKFLGKTLDSNLLMINTEAVAASDLGISDGYYRYTSSDVRYSYEVAPATYTGLAWLDIEESTITRIEQFRSNTTIEAFQTEVSKLSPAPSIVFWVLTVLFIGGSIVGIFCLVYQDYDDGDDNGF